MPYIKESFGSMPDGKTVYRYTLKNRNGVTAGFLDLGAIWHSMLVPDRDGNFADVVLGYDSVDCYLKSEAHLGEIVGRNANRIGGGQFELNGQTYELTVNNGPNNLHSGNDYYRNRIWDARVTEDGEDISICFTLNSPDGDQGFPGNFRVSVTYILTGSDELHIRYCGVSDADTIMNMTNHAYFNLAGHNTGEAMGQKVRIFADSFTPADQVSIPFGTILPVKGTPMDFTEMKAIGRDIENDYEQLVFGSGFDHNWVIRREAEGLSLAAKAWDEASGRAMETWTDLPGVQFYTANYLDSSLPGKEGAVYGRRHGYCFETQYYPDAIHKPQFPSPVIRAGQEKRTETIYKFYVK